MEDLTDDASAGNLVAWDNKPSVIERSLPIAISPSDEPTFRRGVERYQGGLTLNPAPSGIARLRNARVECRDLLVESEDGWIVYDTAIDQAEVLEANGIFDNLWRSTATKMGGAHILLGHPWSFGYYHWLFEILPKLMQVAHLPRLAEAPLLIQNDVKRFQTESLDMLGIDQSRLIRVAGRDAVVDELYIPVSLAPSGSPAPRAVDWLRRKFLAKTDGGSKAGRKLYLSRADAPQRRITNEDEVVAYLETEGFEVILAGNLSFEEQILLFSDAACVIAAHGAAVSNMVFAPQGTPLIEMFGSSYVNGCYWALANVLRQPYGCVIADTSTLDFEVRLNALRDVARKLDMVT